MFSISFSAGAQDRVGIGTTSPQEKLHLEGGNFRIPATNTTEGIIMQSTYRWIHSYGTSNMFAGAYAGNLSLSGSNNIGIGVSSLIALSTGTGNTAVGSQSLFNNSTGNYNVALGYLALYTNTLASYNTAVGYMSLYSNQTGDYNTAIGYGTNINASNLNNTITIGYNAIASNSNEVVVGNTTNDRFFCPAIYNAPANNLGTFLRVDATGLVHRDASSMRYKHNIQNLHLNSSLIYLLRPVMFQNNEDNSMGIGLIAEEVSTILPELVNYIPEKHVIKGSTSDKLIPDGVHYDKLPVLMLMEMKNQKDKIDRNDRRIDELNRKLEYLKAIVEKKSS